MAVADHAGLALEQAQREDEGERQPESRLAAMLRLAEALDLGDRSTAHIAEWVGSHHERLDGLGYPVGLTSPEIPLEARILAVADAYEAMTAERCYRPGMSDERARAELLRCAGTQFDLEVVNAFLTTAVSQAVVAQPDPMAGAADPAAEVAAA